MQTDRRLPNAGNRIKSDNLRIGFSSLLAAAVFLFASVASADIVLLVGPDGTALPVGTYRLVTIPTKADQAVTTQVIVVGISPVSPVVIPPVIVTPDPPLPPVTTGAKALILLETSDSDQQHELIRQAIRKNTSLSPRVMILDPDSRDENNQPDRLVAHARQYLAGRPLPRVLILDAAGSFVADAELPETPDAVKLWLAERGVK